MPKNHFKQTVSTAISLSIVANMAAPVSANELAPVDGKFYPPPPYQTVIKPSSAFSELSFNSVEKKISNFLKAENKNAKPKERKTLATDDSGSCGEGVTYTFTAADGKLTISGSGALRGYATSHPAPWESYKDSIKTVVIGDGVTSIGYEAFDDCPVLTSVTIPDSVTYIGHFAFENCGDLASITIPDSVTSIGDGIFEGCSGLTSIIVDSNNSNYQSIDGVLFNKDATTLICCPAGITGSYTIPDSVTSLDFDAFYGCSGLTSITIPDSVTSLGYHTFYGCSSLTSIAIPDGVTSIGSDTFNSCSRLASITIPDGVTSIGDFAFYRCYSLTSITIPDSVTSIGLEAFNDCDSLTSITIPASVTSIGDRAFGRCIGLTSVSYLGMNDPGSSSSAAFSGCYRLYCLLVPSSYTSDAFCGHSVIKGNCPAPTPTRNPSMYPLPEHSDVGSSNTALIASIVSIAAALVIAGVTSAICYFKNPSRFPCFRTATNDAASDNVEV